MEVTSWGRLCSFIFPHFPLFRWRKEVKPPSPLSQEEIKVRGPYSQTKSGEDIIKGRRGGEGGG